MNVVRCYDEFYLVWESSCWNFIEDVKFVFLVVKVLWIKFYVFLRKDILVKVLLLRDFDWIENYFLLIIFLYVFDMGFIVYFLGKYGDFVELDNEKILWMRVYFVVEWER